MKSHRFDELLESVKEARAIVRGERSPSRTFAVDAQMIRELRVRAKLSQPEFARLLDVNVGTLRNWEQGRRQPTGPAKVLLRAIRNDPRNVLKALAR